MEIGDDDQGDSEGLESMVLYLESRNSDSARTR